MLPADRQPDDSGQPEAEIEQPEGEVGVARRESAQRLTGQRYREWRCPSGDVRRIAT